MLQQIIHRLLKHRHFWRYASFSEIAELYASRLMTVFGIRIVLVFVSVYLYRLGYTLEFIALFWAVYYGLKTLFVPAAALIAARFGPKHGVLYANLLFAVGMVFLFFTEQLGITALAGWCIFQAFAGTLNNLSYMIDFSKVKSVEHAGKELGYMNIVEKVAGAASPVLGGIVASLFGAPSAMALAGVFFIFSAVPLLRTAEPTRLNQKLSFRGFPWRTTWRSFRAQFGIGFDYFASTMAWVLFISVTVFASAGSSIYAKIGILSSIAFVVVLAVSYLFGRLIDHRRGLLLLRVMVIVNSVTHLLRPTVSSSLGVVVNNVANDVATTGYMMAFNRGEFDTADSSGFRIVYLSIKEASMSIGAVAGALLLAAFAGVADPHSALSAYFVITAGVVLIIATPRFRLYGR